MQKEHTKTYLRPTCRLFLRCGDLRGTGVSSRPLVGETHKGCQDYTMHDATYLVVSFNFRTTPIAFATLWGRILILIGARALNNAMWRKCSFVRGDENAVKDHRNKSGMSYSFFTFTAAPTLLRRCRFFLLFRIDCVLRARAGGWALTARDTRERQENLGNVSVRFLGDDVSPNLLLGPVCGIGALQTFVKWAIIGAQ